MLKKPMTTEEFFDRICEILKEKGMMLDILDYALATSEPIPMKTYEYSIRNNLDYGGSEGIYRDLWIEYYGEDSNKQRSSLGTIKTLREDDEAMHIMANLLADFVTQQRRFANANFTWSGADAYAVDENGKRYGWGYSCGTMETAIKKKDELLKQYPKVAVRDNKTRKEKFILQRQHKDRATMPYPF